ncbi:hypothetical protein SH139x_004744 [Planctomycetaceae bacterium SH139]
MHTRRNGSKRRWLALQLAAVVGLGHAGFANADEYDDYFGTTAVNSNVAQTAGQYGDPCPPNPCPPGMPIEYGSMQPTPLGSADVGSGDVGSGDVGSGVAPDQSNMSIPQNDINNFSSLANTTPAQSTGFASNASGAPEMPSMLGDFFGGSSLVLGGGLIGPQTIAVAGGDRRFKIPENVSPIPQDRVFFTYNHFSNAVSDATGVSSDVDRILFGFEKTFLNGNASFEFRLPFSSALDATQRVGIGGQAVEFGNLALTLKANMLSTSTCVISAGAALTVPTGSDYELNNGGALDLLVENESYQLAPFVGFAQQLNRDWFTQGFVQANFDLNGFRVTDFAGGTSGTIQDQNLLFLSSSLGRWLYRQDTSSGRLHKGVAAITELHYTTGLNDGDTVAAGGDTISNIGFNALNLSSALHFQHGPTAVRLGGAAPLRTDDKLFDAEFFIQINRAF